MAIIYPFDLIDFSKTQEEISLEISKLSFQESNLEKFFVKDSAVVFFLNDGHKLIWQYKTNEEALASYKHLFNIYYSPLKLKTGLR